MVKYNTLFWSQRTRLFHLLGRREKDLFTDDPLITQWMVGLMGTVFGDDPDRLAKVSETLDGLRPVWMGDIEYGQRMQFLVAALPGQDRGQEMVLNLVAAAIADLNERLGLAEASARHERALAFKSARGDDSAAGSRRLSYKMRHDGAFHAALRRLDAMKKMRWAGLAADEEDATGAAATEPSPAVETMAESAVTTDGDGLGASDLGVGVGSTPISAVSSDPITAVPNDPIRAEANDSIVVATTIPVPADASDPITAVTIDGGGVGASGLGTLNDEATGEPTPAAAVVVTAEDAGETAVAYTNLTALRAGGAIPAQSREQEPPQGPFGEAETEIRNPQRIP